MCRTRTTCWKLVYVLRGWASDKLLGSYDVERRPVAQSNADFSFGNSIRFIRMREAIRSGNEDHIRFWIDDLDNHLHSIGQALGFTYEEGAASVPMARRTAATSREPTRPATGPAGASRTFGSTWRANARRSTGLTRSSPLSRAP